VVVVGQVDLVQHHLVAEMRVQVIQLLLIREILEQLTLVVVEVEVTLVDLGF
jgi:hypothetical protein